ncbi:MAG: ATP-dependent DNA helicase, partial [Lachnospiraceae bacterium]|nr:ATP-dependent DNA helicase [Lachnospiraceae bacterium]
IRNIIYATHGHALILFTSYWLMEHIYYRISELITEYPLFIMSKGRLDILNDFRQSGNGVLFASDSAGEGIDLAGDILSALVIVKLPFPIPNPVKEHQRSRYESAEADSRDGLLRFKQEVIIPEMLIKLRQWVGRGIRSEEDTVVFSILDSRASSRGRYRGEILANLPTMPVTDRLEMVAQFIRKHKPDDYFFS